MRRCRAGGEQVVNFASGTLTNVTLATNLGYTKCDQVEGAGEPDAVEQHDHGDEHDRSEGIGEPGGIFEPRTGTLAGNGTVMFTNGGSFSGTGDGERT